MLNNFKIDLYKKLTGFLTKKGKKTKSEKIVNTAFLIISKKLNCSLPLLLSYVFLKLNTFVEAKKVRVRRSSHIVPFSLSLQRRSYLVTKWLSKAVLENTQRISIIDKIVNEIISLLDNTDSKSFKLKQLNNNLASSNRSKMHFRW